jgi:hypothetical protein
LAKIIGFVRHLRDEYLRRRRHGLIYYAILAALLIAAFGVLRYFKVSPIPKFPVPGANAAHALGGQALVNGKKRSLGRSIISSAHHMDIQRKIGCLSADVRMIALHQV